MITVDKSTDRWTYLTRLLRALANGDNATVTAVSQELNERPTTTQKTIVKEPQPTYRILSKTGEKVVYTDEKEYQVVSQLVAPDELLDFLASGPPGFLPDELERLMADIDHAREMELSISGNV